MECFVLLKCRQMRRTDPTDVQVHSIHLDEESLLARVEKIRKANSQYRLRQRGPYSWVVGPTSDEGFFGNTPMEFWAVKSKLPSAYPKVSDG
jgi:hypothetical protein